MGQVRGLLGVALVSLAVVACGGSNSAATTHSGPVNARLFFAPVTLDPQAFNDIGSRALVAYAYDSPVAFRNGKIVSELATRWSVTSNSIKLWIRNDVTCSDGSKLGAAEVADSITRMVDPATGGGFVVSSFGQTTGINATADSSDNSVTVTVQKPYGDLLYGMTNVYAICRAALSDPSLLKSKTSGSGQYVLSEFVNGDHYTYLKRNGYKWGPGGMNNDGSQWPSSITFKVIENESTATNLFLSGGLDLTVAQGPDTARLNSSPRVTTKESATVDIYTMQLNHQAGRVTADENIRKALWAGLDRQAFALAIAPGAHIPYTWVDPGGLCFNPQGVGSSMIPFSVSAAQNYAEQAGYAMQNGQLVKGGKQLTVQAVIPNVFGNGAGDFLVSAWGKVGIKVNAVTEPVPQAVNTFATPGANWDVFMGGGGDYSPTILIKQYGTSGPPNFAAVNNQAFLQLAGQAAVTPTQSACGLWTQAEQELYKAADMLPFMLAEPTTYGHNLAFTPWLLTGVYPDTLHWT